MSILSCDMFNDTTKKCNGTTTTTINEILPHEILQLVFDYIGSSDLIACRDVCSLWRHEFYTPQRKQRFFAGIHHEDAESIESFSIARAKSWDVDHHLRNEPLCPYIEKTERVAYLGEDLLPTDNSRFLFRMDPSGLTRNLYVLVQQCTWLYVLEHISSDTEGITTTTTTTQIPHDILDRWPIVAKTRLNFSTPVNRVLEFCSSGPCFAIKFESQVRFEKADTVDIGYYKANASHFLVADYRLECIGDFLVRRDARISQMDTNAGVLVLDISADGDEILDSSAEFSYILIGPAPLLSRNTMDPDPAVKLSPPSPPPQTYNTRNASETVAAWMEFVKRGAVWIKSPLLVFLPQINLLVLPKSEFQLIRPECPRIAPRQSPLYYGRQLAQLAVHDGERPSLVGKIAASTTKNARLRYAGHFFGLLTQQLPLYNLYSCVVLPNIARNRVYLACLGSDSPRRNQYSKSKENSSSVSNSVPKKDTLKLILYDMSERHDDDTTMSTPFHPHNENLPPNTRSTPLQPEQLVVLEQPLKKQGPVRPSCSSLKGFHGCVKFDVPNAVYRLDLRALSRIDIFMSKPPANNEH